MPNQSRIKIKHLDKKLSQFYIATSVNPKAFGEIRTHSDFASHLGVAKNTLSSWITGKETTERHTIPAEYLNTLANFLVKLQPGKVSLEMAENLWMHASYLSFAAYIIGRPYSRVEELLEKFEPNIDLSIRVKATRRGLISTGPIKTPVRPDYTVTVGKPFEIMSLGEITGWQILLGRSNSGLQMIIPNQRLALDYARNVPFKYPREGEYPRLNMVNEIYTFTLMTVQSNIPPPVVAQRVVTQVLNPTDELCLVNSLSDVGISWGAITVLASSD